MSKEKVKAFNDEWRVKKIKDWTKEERMFLLGNNINNLVEFYIAEGHKVKHAELVSELFDRMETKMFAKTLLGIIKDKREDRFRVDIGIALMVNLLIEQRHDKMEEETMELYGNVVKAILKKPTKQIAEDTGLEKDLIRELLVIVPHPSVVTNDRFISIYVRSVMRKIYTLAEKNELGLNEVKVARKLMTALFGAAQLNNVAVALLLERGETIRKFNEKQKEVWTLFTDFALGTIEDNKKKEIDDLLVDRYIDVRSKEAGKDRDTARRIQFGSISEETFPKLVSVINQLKQQDKYAKYL